ncbi:MAG: nucleotide exchange factor GrpE [Clostridia bacterium]|nr:nucleotide exchange factor GrpE [Clostridia bacterium]MBR2875356.1 nucleotide exchange factor GrpE [Clostridia bacterium]
MANKKKDEKETIDYLTVDFDSLSVEEQKKAFESVKEQNGFLKLLIKESNEKIDELEQKASGKVSDDTYMRLLADFENFKRRNQTAISTAYVDGKVDVIKGFLDVVDNLERATLTMTDESDKKGVELIKKQCDELFKKLGVAEIETLNQPFNPNLHNAVMQVEAENESQVDTCVEVFQKGYTLDGKVIRYSVVKVAK